jgi:hypothetical protein
MALAMMLAILVGACVLLVLARYADDPAVLRDRFQRLGHSTPLKREIAPGRLRFIVSELLEGMGLRVLEVEPLDSTGAIRLVATGAGVLRDVRHIIYVEPSPVGHRVGASRLLALAEDVAHNGGGLGVVVTPYEIDRSGVAGMAADLELIDGRTLLGLINEYLPAHAAEMRTYRIAEVGMRGRPSMLHDRVARGHASS